MSRGGAADEARASVRPGRLVALGVTGAVAAVGAWVLGLDAAHAVALALAVLGVGAVLSALAPAPAEPWPRRERPARAGAYGEVQRLSWSLRARHGTVRPDALRRLRRIVVLRLAETGLELDAPADRDEIDRILGGRETRVLLAGDGTRVPPAAVRRVLDVLDRLDALEAPGTIAATAAARRTPSLTPAASAGRPASAEGGGAR